MSDKWKWLIDEPFWVSKKCCDKLKKEPFYAYEHRTGAAPILGVISNESNQRTTDYLTRGGCNVFGHTKHDRNTSHLMSIWI